MADDITIRVLERSDIDAVLELLRAALGEPPLLERTAELFAWKHFDNPFGESIALVAMAGEKLVGLRTFMRWELRKPQGGILRCVRAVDTATHPEFHRRGIFRNLTELALRKAEAEGVDLVFNTPNGKSGSGYLSMGWVEVGRIGVQARPTRHIASLMRSRTLETAELVGTATPANWSRVPLDRAPLGLRTPRTEEYLNWRFTAHPTARYFTLRSGSSEVVVRPNVRNGRQELLVSDVFGRHRHQAMRRIIRETRAPYVATWFSKGSPERSAAVRTGMLPVPGVTALTLMARPLRDLDVDVTSMSSWDLALSDLELL